MVYTVKIWCGLFFRSVTIVTVFYPVTQVQQIFKKFLQLKLMMPWFLKFIQFLRNCDSLTFIYLSSTKFWSEGTVFLIFLPSWIFKLQKICFWKSKYSLLRDFCLKLHIFACFPTLLLILKKCFFVFCWGDHHNYDEIVFSINLLI